MARNSRGQWLRFLDKSGRATGEGSTGSDFDLLGDDEGIIHIDSQIPDRALEFRMRQV